MHAEKLDGGYIKEMNWIKVSKNEQEMLEIKNSTGPLSHIRLLRSKRHFDVYD